MAKQQSGRAKRRTSTYLFLKTLCNATILIACLVLCIGGVQSGVRTIRIVYNCLAVSSVIGVVFWAVIRAVTSYEEINSGKA
jgi:hypothetical protein